MKEINHYSTNINWKPTMPEPTISERIENDFFKSYALKVYSLVGTRDTCVTAIQDGVDYKPQVRPKQTATGIH